MRDLYKIYVDLSNEAAVANGKLTDAHLAIRSSSVLTNVFRFQG
jgi:hypothetical protein